MSGAMQRVLAALEIHGCRPRRSGSNHVARCPSHDDRVASLSIREGREGRALLRCHAGCELEQILAALRLTVADLFDAPQIERSRETRYAIRDANGLLVATHVRRDGPDGKTLHWERDGKPTLGGLTLARLPLYGSERLATAPAGEPVILVEGEKPADALLKHGFCALGTATGAAGCPGAAVLQVLAGRDVILWPDNDAPGCSHMEKVKARLGNIARSVRVFEWAGAPPRGDAADFLANGGTADKLRSELAAIERESVSAAPRDAVPAETHLRFLTAAEITALGTQTVPWVAPPWVASGCITLIDGKVKSAGKTTFTAALVRQVVRGDEFLGQATRRTRVVWLTEQSPTSFQQVLRRAQLEQCRDVLVLSWYDTRDRTWPDVVGAAVEKAHEFGAEMLVVDTMSQFAGLAGDSENAAGDALRAVQPLQTAAAQGLAVLICRHERKSGGDVGDSGRGSSATAGAVDIVLALRRPEGATRPTIRSLHGLSRLDGTPDELMIELVDGHYVSLGTAHDVVAQEARQTILKTCPSRPTEALPLKAILEQNPTLKRTTAQEAIDGLVSTGHVLQLGGGKRGDPHRYHRNELVSAAHRDGVPADTFLDDTAPNRMVSAETPAGSGRMYPDQDLTTEAPLTEAEQSLKHSLFGGQA